MRPVVKLKHSDPFEPYQTAKRLLVDEIGGYCSYCERRIPSGLAVEHVQPKSLVPDLETNWDNFLLACSNCNSCKSSKDVNISNLTDYLWPDQDDTYHAIAYDKVSAIPSASSMVDKKEQGKVDKLLKLVGLDKPAPKEGTTEYERAADTRIADRLTALRHAKEWRTTYEKFPIEGKQMMLPLLLINIKDAGFWSIWMHEFEDVPEIREEILNCLPGTNKQYF